MPQGKADSWPVCVRHPHLFDRINEGETKKQANERMAHAAHLCKVACHRLEQCSKERRGSPYPQATGVVAGRYRGFPVSERKVSA